MFLIDAAVDGHTVAGGGMTPVAYVAHGEHQVAHAEDAAGRADTTCDTRRHHNVLGIEEEVAHIVDVAAAHESHVGAEAEGGVFVAPHRTGTHIWQEVPLLAATEVAEVREVDHKVGVERVEEVQVAGAHDILVKDVAVVVDHGHVVVVENCHLADVGAVTGEEARQLEADGPDVAVVAADHHVAGDVPELGTLGEDMLELERVEEGTHAEAGEPVLAGVAAFEACAAVVGVVGPAAGEADGGGVEIACRRAFDITLGQEEAFVLQEEIPMRAETHRQVCTKHRLEVAREAIAAIECQSCTKTNQRIDGERYWNGLVVDMEECGVDIPHELGAAHETHGGGRVAVAVGDSGAAHQFGGDTEGQRTHQPARKIDATRGQSEALAGHVICGTGAKRQEEGVVGVCRTLLCLRG